MMAFALAIQSSTMMALPTLSNTMTFELIAATLLMKAVGFVVQWIGCVEVKVMFWRSAPPP